MLYKFLGKICVCVNLKTIFSKALLCHTELSQESEVSIKSKCGYFANAQYDNGFLLWLAPCPKRTSHKNHTKNL